MRIESFLAARVEPGEGGFACWGGLIRIDAKISWAFADCVGRAPRFAVPDAQYVGSIAILKRLRDLRAQNPEGSLTMLTDSRRLVEELRGEWRQSQRGSSAILDAGIELNRSLAPLTLRYCSRSANSEAHALITLLCRRHGVPVRERTVRQ